MCMISFIPAGVEIPRHQVLNGATFNRDGHGWAVASNDGIKFGHHLSSYAAMDAFEAARKEAGDDSIALFHSRYGTHGPNDLTNVHPFFAGDKKTVVAHNGIMPKRFHPVEGDPRSDTRVFVDTVLDQFLQTPTGVPSYSGNAALGHFIGVGNKLVILSTESGKPEFSIVNEDQGYWVDGVWFSNGGYLDHFVTVGSWKTSRSNLGLPVDSESEDTEGAYFKADECVWCLSKGGIVSSTNECMYCGTCQVCCEFDSYCSCGKEVEVKKGVQSASA